MERIYLAGPMSGLPQFNFPAFYAAAKRLREIGFDVVSPAELDDEITAKAALASAEGKPQDQSLTWGDFLARDVKLIADGGINGIVFLPNWFKSRGARLEATVGLLSGSDFKFYEFIQGCVSPPLSHKYVSIMLDRQVPFGQEGT